MKQARNEGDLPGLEPDLGAFLRARRDALLPRDVGLPTGSDRRVPGLRREEVALLAGVSVDYVNRIEQGRERYPSAQVLEALGRALRLDEHAMAYLARVGRRPEDFTPALADQVADPLVELMDAMEMFPAYVVDPALNILATNAMADALFSRFAQRDNLMRMIFLDPHAKDFYLDWDHAAEGVVRNFRANVAETPDYPPVAAVVGELVVRSPAFAGLWARYEVRPRTLEDKAFQHPLAGRLTLRFQSFRVDSAPGQRLYVYTPTPGDTSANALRILRSLAVKLALEPNAESISEEHP
ncbi:helix-turn-helix transcriptional regulator [Streptomyces albidoflavus]